MRMKMQIKFGANLSKCLMSLINIADFFDLHDFVLGDQIHENFKT